ncbi:hypothetical protein HDE_11959 [Halotydeus destructor]|nr:hypothetical protein HDE_11959 [Halotydeus destructor]
MNIISAITVVSLICSAYGQNPGVDIPGDVLSSIGSLTRQFAGIQGALTQLSSQFQTLLATSTRLVTGLQEESNEGEATATTEAPVTSPEATTSTTAEPTTASPEEPTASPEAVTTTTTELATASPEPSTMTTTEPTTTSPEPITSTTTEPTTTSPEPSTTTTTEPTTTSSEPITSTTTEPTTTRPEPSTTTTTEPTTTSLKPSTTTATPSPPSTPPPTPRPTDPVTTVVAALQAIGARFVALRNTLGDFATSLRSLFAGRTRIPGNNRVSGGGRLRHFADQQQRSSFTHSLVDSLTDLTVQMNEISNVLTSLNTQFRVAFHPPSHLVGGLDEETKPETSDPAGSVLSAINTATQQFLVAQQTLAEMSRHMSRIVATSSKFVTGNGSPPPIDSILVNMQRVTLQFHEIQSAARSISGQVNRMIETGTRMIGGTGNLFYEEADPSPLHLVLNAWNQLTSQIRSMQSLLEDVNKQFNILVSSNMRVLTGTPNVQFQAESIAGVANAISGGTRSEDIISGMQRATAELTRNLGALGSTLTKMAQGATGFRLAGQRSNVGDDYSSLNAVAVLGRQVGNFAGALNRAVGG